MRVGWKFTGQIFLKLPKHAESAYAMDATRNAAGAVSAEGLIYNALLVFQTNFHLVLTYYTILNENYIF